jgi:dihydroorotate dehydrogenase electron transfer subunit
VGRVTGPLELLKGWADQISSRSRLRPRADAGGRARLAERYGQPSEVSMERTMGCGLGGCYSCVVPVKHVDGQTRYVRSCIGGPVFDGATVVWE